MVSKSTHLGTRLEPESYKKSQNYMPGPSLENHLKKVAHRLQTQTLQTMKSSVWCGQNHSLHHSSFPATFPEMWSKGSLIWDTLATQIRKHNQNKFPDKLIKKGMSKHIDFLWKWNTFVWFSGSLFHGFSDPDPTWPPKPQKVRKRSPKCNQIVTKRSPKRIPKPQKQHRILKKTVS